VVITVERKFTVAQPVEKIFDYLKDFTHTEQWDPGTVSTTRLDAGPIVVGSRFANVSQFLGRKTELEYELRTMDVNAHLVFAGNNKSASTKDDLTMRSLGATTEIRYLAEIKFHGLANLVSPLVQIPFNKIADKTIAQLSQVLAAL
jgi:carbon monoxide dehydrogenase subunit G